MHIYSVYENSIQIFLLCPEIVYVNQSEKCHLGWSQMPPNVWGQREAMVEIHYNHYLEELRSPRKERKYLKQIHIKCHIQNHIWGCHVQYNGTLDPLQYFITSCDTSTRPRILQKVDRIHSIQWRVFKIWKLCN